MERENMSKSDKIKSDRRRAYEKRMAGLALRWRETRDESVATDLVDEVNPILTKVMERWAVNDLSVGKDDARNYLSESVFSVIIPAWDSSRPLVPFLWQCLRYKYYTFINSVHKVHNRPNSAQLRYEFVGLEEESPRVMRKAAEQDVAFDSIASRETMDKMSMVARKHLTKTEWKVYSCLIKGMDYEESMATTGFSHKKVDNARERIKKKLFEIFQEDYPDLCP